MAKYNVTSNYVPNIKEWRTLIEVIEGVGARLLKRLNDQIEEAKEPQRNQEIGKLHQSGYKNSMRIRL